MELQEYIKAVHDKGFNISMMINTFKKKQRDRGATYQVPDEVYADVCIEYLKRGDNIDHSYPYFMKVLVMKSQDSCANASQKYEKFGKMTQSIKSIMQGVT